MASQGGGDLRKSESASIKSSSNSTPSNPPSLQPQSTGKPTVNSIETTEKIRTNSQPFGKRSLTPLTPLFRKPESPRSAIQNEANPAKQAKIAIPRLKRSAEVAAETSSRSGGRHRVNHACEPCRHRKTKCSGERPVCRHCQDFKIVCKYADGKRDRVKKQFGSMTEKVADYEKLLRELSTRVGDTDAELIRSMLERDVSVDYEGTGPENLSTQDGYAENDGSDGEEYVASAGAGSTGALDRTEEDFTRNDAKATGFMGKNSEITWMQRLRQENKYGTPPPDGIDGEFRETAENATGIKNLDTSFAPPPAHEESFTVQDASYHMDNVDILAFEMVDQYELPTKDMADHLFESYIHRVHPSFPIIGKNLLSTQYAKFISGEITKPPDKWLAILNMMFAIGAKYSHLVEADWRGDDRDHLIYFTRARLLGLNGDLIFEHPDLQHIQIAGLMSFYMLCTSQMNRAWQLAGIAIRGATGLGMNMRSESPELPDSYKEIRYRVWWALYTLEHRLCSISGRICSILEDHITTPLPLPYEEEEFEKQDVSQMLKVESQQGERNPATSRSSSIIGSTPSTDRSRSLSKPEFSRSPSSQQSDLQWAKNAPPSSSLYFLYLVQLTRLTQGIFHKLYTPAAIAGSWKDTQTNIDQLQRHLDDWYKELPASLDFKRKQRDKSTSASRMSLGFFFYGTSVTINRPTLCRLDRKMPNQSKESHEFNFKSAARCVEAAQEMISLIPGEPNAVGLNRVGPFWSILHWLMQASTVLMLELCFRAYHVPQDADNILESAKKAVRWIHALGEQSPSARKAWVFCDAMIRDAARKIGAEITDIPTQPPRNSSISSQGNPINSNMSYQPTNPVQTIYSSSQGAPNFQAYAVFDSLMQHDQYFPAEANVQAALQGSQYTAAEMEFLNNTYLNQDGHHQNPNG